MMASLTAAWQVATAPQLLVQTQVAAERFVSTGAWSLQLLSIISPTASESLPFSSLRVAMGFVWQILQVEIVSVGIGLYSQYLVVSALGPSG